MIAMASIDIAPAIERVGATNAGDPDAANGYPWQHLTLHVTIVRSDDLWENAFFCDRRLELLSHHAPRHIDPFAVNTPRVLVMSASRSQAGCGWALRASRQPAMLHVPAPLTK
jgi:hypothetical protein